MSRRTVNILMSILVIIYTVFVIAHLITAVDDPMSENRVLSILASGVGAIVGIWLAVSILRYRYKSRSSKETSPENPAQQD